MDHCTLSEGQLLGIINDFNIHPKRLQKEKKSKPKKIRRRKDTYQNATDFKILPKILSIICASEYKRLVAFENWKEL
jgi:hypothetical protein